MISPNQDNELAGDRLRLGTVSMAAEESGVFSEGALRWRLFHRDENGLAECVVKIGRRVYLDLDAFDRWLKSHRESRAA